MPTQFAPYRAQMMPDAWTMHDWYPLWGAWHMLIGLITFIALVAIAWLLIQKLAAGSSGDVTRNHALDVLSERYAKGEVDREEYLRRRQDILGA